MKIVKDKKRRRMPTPPTNEWPLQLVYYNYFYVQRMPLVKGRTYHQYQLVKFNTYKDDIKKRMAKLRMLQKLFPNTEPTEYPLFGVIKFHGPWRKFILVPEGGTLWSWACMEQAQNFLDAINKDPDQYEKFEEKPVDLTVPTE